MYLEDHSKSLIDLIDTNFVSIKSTLLWLIGIKSKFNFFTNTAELQKL